LANKDKNRGRGVVMALASRKRMEMKEGKILIDLGSPQNVVKSRVFPGENQKGREEKKLDRNTQVNGSKQE